MIQGFAPIDLQFLSGSLAGMSPIQSIQDELTGPQSILEPEEQRADRAAFEATGSGDISLTEAVCQLMDSLQTHYERIFGRIFYTQERLSVAEWLQRQDLPPSHWLFRFLEENPTVRRTDASGRIEGRSVKEMSVTRVILPEEDSTDFDRQISSFHALAHSAAYALPPVLGLDRAVFFPHPDEKELRVWEQLPPPLLLGALTYLYGRNAYALCLCLTMPTMDEARMMVQRGSRPVYIAPRAPRSEVHGRNLNHPYGILLHDVFHALSLSCLRQNFPDLPDRLLKLSAFLTDTPGLNPTFFPLLPSLLREMALDGPVLSKNSFNPDGSLRGSAEELCSDDIRRISDLAPLGFRWWLKRRFREQLAGIRDPFWAGVKI